MNDGGIVHVDCIDGYRPAVHDALAVRFAEVVRAAGHANTSPGEQITHFLS
jgi:hypothetical protein